MTGKKIVGRWNHKKIFFKTIPNKINNNKKNEDPIWYMKKIEKDEIKKNLI